MGKSAPRVDQYMTRLPHVIDRGATLAEAHDLMRKYQIRHLPVMDNGKLVGMISLRDLHLIETLEDVDPESVQVEEAMTEQPYTVQLDEPIDKVAAHMAAQKYGSAIVFDKREVKGIFTTTDALIALLHMWKTAP